MFLCNAFSLQMIKSVPANIKINEVGLEYVIEVKDQLVSVVGHADTANVLSSLLGLPEYLRPRKTEGTMIHAAARNILEGNQ